MNFLVVDDEKLASARVQRILNELGHAEVTCINDPLEAIAHLATHKYDVVFLDIQMPEVNGLELANKILELEPKTFVIFQTAYDHYAIEAFKAGGIDYILKPISKESIQNALDKVKNYLSNAAGNQNKKIMGKNGNKIYLIQLDDIYYIKADLDEVIVRVKEASVYVKKKIGQMAELLSSETFFKVHRSIIVNVDKIKSMQSVEQSKLEISFDGINDVVTSSKDGAKEFREYLERRSL